jgi:tetratricopeptide (TPR) repeat protein
VAFFRIIVTGKRKEYARAADECDEWLRLFPRDRRSYESLGVQLELAKNLIAQLPELEGANRDKAIRIATDNLTEVVRIVSPFKPEAVTLLQKYKPNAALSLADISKLNYDESMAQANQAVSTLAYENAIALFKHAIARSGSTRDIAKTNSARYMLAYCELMTKKYYEAAVVAEHIARKYPRDELAPKAAELAMQATVEAYTTFTAGNRTADLDRLADLARYTAATWPEVDQGDSGRLYLGQVTMGRGQYAEAIAAFDAVRTASSKWIDAQTQCGIAHWRLSLELREKGKAKEADAEVQKSVDKLKTSLKARRDANAPDTDIALISNTCDLAEIELDTNQSKEAMALLEPLAKKLGVAKDRPAALNTAYSRVEAGILRGHVIDNKVEDAIADMKILEGIGGAGNSTASLYFELSKLLESEMEKLKKKKDPAGLKKMELSFQKFLKTLVATKNGQSFESLKWAADNLLRLGSPKEANEVYTMLVNTYATDPAFLKKTKAGELVYLVKIKQVAALRQIGNLPEAEKLLDDLLAQNKRSLEAQIEKGFLLDAKAEAKKGSWLESYNHWQKEVAMKLENQKPKPPQYFEAWYQTAAALKKLGDSEKDTKKQQTDYALAKTTLARVMRLSPTVGTPEWKAKYDSLLKDLSK